jgi:outer membrane protein OmpU
MRESQMKKIIAAAVAAAFVAPAFAADVTISGAGEVIFIDTAGSTSTQVDQAFTVGASTELANGMTVSTDINIGADDDGENSKAIFNEGGNSVTVSGAFGKIDIGDTSGAVDAIDDVTESAKELGVGSGGNDAAVLWTLPSLAEGLTVNLSMNTDTNTADSDVDSAGKANGVSVKYANSGLTVGYGVNDYDSNVEEAIYNATYSMSGVTVAMESLKDTAADGTETKYSNFGITYATGDLKLGYETQEKKSSGSVSNEYNIVTAQYSLGGGVTAYVETYEDTKTADSDKTALGLEFKF